MTADYACFHTAGAEFSNGGRDHIAHKAKNIYSQALYRESHPASGTAHLGSLSTRLTRQAKSLGGLSVWEGSNTTVHSTDVYH